MPRFVKWSQVVSCAPRFDNCVSIRVCGKLIPKSVEKEARSQSQKALSVWTVYVVCKVDDFGLPGSSEETVEMVANCCLGQKLK